MAGITGRREGWKTLDCKPGADYTALVPPLPREVREQYLSKYYRVSNWAVEAERGFLHRTGGAPWSYLKGLRELGVIA